MVKPTDTAKPEHYLSGGMIFFLTNDVQFDLRGGLGMCDAADDYYVGAGGAYVSAAGGGGARSGCRRRAAACDKPTYRRSGPT